MLSVPQLLAFLAAVSTINGSKSRFAVKTSEKDVANVGAEFALDNEMKCAQQCHETESCTGFNFADANQTCQLVIEGPANPLTIPDPNWNHATKCGRRSLFATVTSLLQTSVEFNWLWCDGNASPLNSGVCEWGVLLRVLSCGSATDKNIDQSGLIILHLPKAGSRPGDGMYVGNSQFNITKLDSPEHWDIKNPLQKHFEVLPLNPCIYFVVFEDDNSATGHRSDDDDFCEGEMEMRLVGTGTQKYEVTCNTTTPGIPVLGAANFNPISAALKLEIEVELTAVNC